MIGGRFLWYAELIVKQVGRDLGVFWSCCLFAVLCLKQGLNLQLVP